MQTSDSLRNQLRTGWMSSNGGACWLTRKQEEGLAADLDRLEELEAHECQDGIARDGVSYVECSREEWNAAPFESTGTFALANAATHYLIDAEWLAEYRAKNALPDGVYRVTRRGFGPVRECRAFAYLLNGSWWWDEERKIPADEDLAADPCPERFVPADPEQEAR